MLCMISLASSSLCKYPTAPDATALITVVASELDEMAIDRHSGFFSDRALMLCVPGPSGRPMSASRISRFSSLLLPRKLALSL